MKCLLIHWFVLSLLGTSLSAKVIELKPTDDWFSVLNGDGLKPGDAVVLRGGTYSDRRMLTLKHRGTKEKPIIIGGRKGEKVVFRRPDAKQNSFNLVGVQHLTIQDIEITGGSSGIRISADGDTQPKHVTLQDLHIHHIGGVAVTCNHKGSHYEHMIFRRNHIHHTSGHGEGFYLGANNEKDGTTPATISNSRIEFNYIHDLNGSNISQGDGIEIKDGSYGNTIAHNVIHDTNYPGILVYGTDGEKPNIIEGNVIWNTKGNGIQAAADAKIINNIIFNVGNDAIHVRAHQSAKPGNMLILHNTIVQKSSNRTGLRIQKPDGGFTGDIIIANNAIYSPIALRTPKDEKLIVIGNAGKGGCDDKTLDEKAWHPGGNLTKDLDANYYPLPKSFLIGKAKSSFKSDKEVVSLGGGFDFLGRKRLGMAIGAYNRTDRKQGWFIKGGIKELDY